MLSTRGGDRFQLRPREDGSHGHSVTSLIADRPHTPILLALDQRDHADHFEAFVAAAPGLHEQLVAIFHLLRVGAVTLAVLATYDFLAFVLAEVRLRRLGLALGATALILGVLMLFTYDIIKIDWGM